MDGLTPPLPDDGRADEPDEPEEGRDALDPDDDEERPALDDDEGELARAPPPADPPPNVPA